jgi:condensin-2 complex subunit G2
MLDLLLLVRKMRSIKFYEVVPVDALLLRLTVAPPAISKKITALLLSSYFPVSKPLGEQVKRGWSLLRKHPEAGKLFFANVHHHAPGEAILKLISGFHQFLVNSSSKANPDGEDEEQGKSKKKKQKKSVEATAADGNVLWAKDPRLVEVVLCCMAQLWHTARSMEDAEGEAMQDLAHAVELHGGVHQMLALFPSDLARVAILTMTSFLPQLNASAASDDTLSQLRALPSSAAVPDYGPLLECLFAWGRGDEAMALICDGMDAAIGSQLSTKSKKSTAAAVPHLCVWIA